MPSYYRVSPAFWSDNPSWGDDVRLAALYLLTCPHRTTEGFFRLPLPYAATDLGWVPERFAEAFGQLLRDGFAEYDEAVHLCLIVKALKWQAPANPNGVKAAVRAVEELPDSPLHQRFYQLAQRFCEPLAEALAQRFPERLGEPPSPSPSPSPSTTPAGPSRPDRSKSVVRELFDYWCARCNHPAAKLTSDRRSKIEARLRDGYSPEQIRTAIDGAAVGAFVNDAGKRFDDLELICRSGSKLEDFIGRAVPTSPQPSTVSVLAAYSSAREER